MTEDALQEEEETRAVQSTTPYRNAYRDAPEEDLEATGGENDATTEDEAGPDNFMATQPSEVDYKKRYDDLKRHYDTKVNTHKQEVERLNAERLVEERMEKSSLRTPEQLAEFRQEYSEVYDTVETLATTAADERVAHLEAKLNKMEESKQEEVATSAFSELLAYHPDFSELSQSPEFHQWLGEQPEGISKGVLENNTDAKWAAKVISLFKTETGVKSTKRKPAANSAAMEVNPTKRATPIDKNAARVWKRSEINGLKAWEYEKMESEIDLAWAEGRVVNG